MAEWREEPFAPWTFDENVLLSVLSFFETNLIQEGFSLKKELSCEVFMDSGAFAAASMGFNLDPYEVAEMQAILKADLIVPLDLVIFEYESEEIARKKIQQTIQNTEILLDYKPKDSEIVAPLQGYSREILEGAFDSFRSLGLSKFAIGGIVFQSNLEETLERIKLARKITNGYSLHVFGKFLHPELLNYLKELQVDSVDGYGYIISSIKGLYIHQDEYQPITELNQESLSLCSCLACQDSTIEDFTRGDKEAQFLLIKHNIESLIKIAGRKAVLKENKG